MAISTKLKFILWIGFEEEYQNFKCVQTPDSKWWQYLTWPL